MTTGGSTHSLDFDVEALAEVCRRFEVAELRLFGSAAKGEMTEASDVDLLVTFRPGARIGLVRLGRLAEALEPIFRRAVDLVPEDGLKSGIRDEVLATAQSLYAA